VSYDKECMPPINGFDKDAFDKFDADLRYAIVSVGLFCVCSKSLLPYDRALLTLTHTHTSAMLVICRSLLAYK